MQSSTIRGDEEENLPNTSHVLRAFQLPDPEQSDDQVGQSGRSRNKFEFRLSTNDLQANPPNLSVFEDTLTTKVQACRLIGNGTTHRVISRMNVGDIHAIKSDTALTLPATDLCTTFLRVAWITAFRNDENGQRVLDTRPGAEGHAGILGLNIKKGIPNRTIIRKEIETALSLFAERDCTTLSKDDLAA